MLIGIDFDNTIVCYGTLFFDVACELGLLPPSAGKSKDEVRRVLRESGREDDWTRIQGIVYGERMRDAKPFVGVKEFLKKVKERGDRAVVVSHKTRFPVIGTKVDLHDVARRWLEENAFFSADEGSLLEDDVFFELSQEEKAARIRGLGCDCFVDDLPEFLLKDMFSPAMRKILFDPQNCFSAQPGVILARSWEDISKIIIA